MSMSEYMNSSPFTIIPSLSPKKQSQLKVY